MAANRRNARRVSIDSNPLADTATFMAAMNSMATTMRDSTTAIRESAAATNRAMEYMGRRTGNNGNGGDNDEMDNGVGGNNRPMTLATFLKVNPPSFSGATTVTKADEWFREMERSLRAQQVPEDQYVSFATYMLKGDAHYWWQGVC
ncbi:hypothetical protein PIB30_086450 [Stylosanthes scabra]|uniref:Retrotransposon gag domain-containing protein n=2 Tax=Stylosanthes scabra TaxID=79078 RepID=A0ABU6XVI0_9FABA|nr:hypothetical protein [Stylosanthes scabra]